MCRSLLFACAFLFLGLDKASAEDTKPIDVELKVFTFKVPADLENLFGLNVDEGKLFFYSGGKAEAKVKVPAEGTYEIIVKASGDKALDEGAKFKLSVGDKQIGKETETTDEPKEFKFSAMLKAGENVLTIEFTNDAYKENEYDRNLYIHGFTLTLQPAK